MTATLADGLIDAPRLAAPAEARRRLASLIETPAAADLAPELDAAGRAICCSVSPIIRPICGR